ncbi:MAG: oligosaccharide flippase family protein [Bacteroidia bacterium]|nr:oligosaccharide flippase family protein [Bacteroidia bacterium]
MKQIIKSELFKTLSIYTIANFINASIPFFILPFLTKYLPPSDYGLITIFQIFTFITLTIVGLNSTAALNRRYFDKEQYNIPVYITNSIYILIITAIITILLFLFFGGLLNKYTQFPEQWLWAVVVFCFCHNLSEIILTLWRVQFKALHYALFRIARTIFDIGITITVILFFNNTWQGRIEGQIISICLFAAIAAFFLIKEKWISIAYNSEYIKDLLRYGLPLVPHVICGVLLSMNDKIFITNIFGLSVTGLYSTGYQVGAVIALVQNSFNQAWVPWFFEKLKKDDSNIKYQIVKYTYLYNIAMVILVILVTAATPAIFKFFINENYHSAQQFVFWIALGFGFNGMYMMIVNYLFYLGKTITISLTTIIVVVVNIVLNYSFIKYNGIIGAAQATAITYFFNYILVWIVSARYYKMPWFFFFRLANSKK